VRSELGQGATNRLDQVARAFYCFSASPARRTMRAQDSGLSFIQPVHAELVGEFFDIGWAMLHKEHIGRFFTSYAHTMKERWPPGVLVAIQYFRIFLVRMKGLEPSLPCEN
jgi:hypothetical protein